MQAAFQTNLPLFSRLPQLPIMSTLAGEAGSSVYPTNRPELWITLPEQLLGRHDMSKTKFLT